MTNSAQLKLQRFMVFSNGMVIYSQEFHAGLNIIRGDHSVGKSTLIDLIFYVLGGEIRREQWVYPADQCDAVCAQVLVNNKVFCLKRDIEVGSIPKIDIIEGTYESSYRSLVGWQSYGPRRTDSKVSFSQLFFDLLGWGASKTDDYANLTMHQVLRLLYADQETPANKIFRAEPPNADNELTRLAVAEFLLSLDDLELHRSRQELLIANRLFDKADAELSAILGILGKDASYSVDQLNHDISVIFEDMENIRRYQNLQKGMKNPDLEDSDDNFEIDNLTLEIEELAAVISEKDKDLGLYVAEISDCVAFSRSLIIRKKALLESKSTYQAIGSSEFKRCPCCNENITPSTVDQVCSLCKQEYTSDDRYGMYLQVLAELEFQEKQNEKLLKVLQEKLGTGQGEMRVTVEKLNVKKAILRNILGTTSKLEAEMLEASRKLGFAESQANNLTEKVAIIQKVEDLRNSKLGLIETIVSLRDRISALSASNVGRRNRVLDSIGKRALNILERDEKYELVFADASTREVEIDFAKDRWLVDGRAKFSGSSNFFKKNALHVAILSYAISDLKCRHPRFLLLDDIENGGMTAPRSQNFQRILADIVKGNEDRCQVIIATAMVDPSLDNEVFGVGPAYVKGDYVLKV